MCMLSWVYLEARIESEDGLDCYWFLQGLFCDFGLGNDLVIHLYDSVCQILPISGHPHTVWLPGSLFSCLVLTPATNLRFIFPVQFCTFCG